MTRFLLRAMMGIALLLVLCIEITILVSNVLLLKSDHEFIYAGEDSYYLMSVERGIKFALPELPPREAMSWTPDGEYVTYFIDNFYFVFDIDTREVRSQYIQDVVMSRNTTPLWSASGRQFVATGYLPENAPETEQFFWPDTFLFSVDPTYQITDIQHIFYGDLAFRAWSPDGTRVAIVNPVNSVNTPILIYDTESGTSTTHLVDSLPAFPIHWWDDNRIVFVREDGIYRIDLITDEITFLWETGYNPFPVDNDWQIHPNRTRLIYDGSLYSVSENSMTIAPIHAVGSVAYWSQNSAYLMTVVSYTGTSCVTNCRAVAMDIVIENEHDHIIRRVAINPFVRNFAWRPQ